MWVAIKKIRKEVSMKSSGVLRVAKFLKYGIFALQGVAITLAIIETLKKSNKPQKNNFGPEQDRDRVDQASWESFPASDPPSWNRTTTKVHH